MAVTFVQTAVDLSVDLGPLRLPNPVTLASGTCGYGVELSDFLDLRRLGGVFTKGLTLLPRAGNAPERIAESPSGLINRIGLQNVGVDAFLSAKLPALAAFNVPVIANVAGATIDEYVMIVETLAEAVGLAAIELNVSCPNVDCGGIEFGVDAGRLAELVSAVRPRTPLPLIVKLTPNVTDIGEMARPAESAGADVLSAINTVTGLSVSPRLQDGRLSPTTTVRGGLSGPAIKPIALRCVWQAAQACRLPIIGIGGISSLDDMLAFFAVGASAIQIGTATFIEPGIGGRLTADLAEWLAAQGISRFAEVLPAREVQG
ncbi:MAG: dihydroorotate dehydrogenase [Candidatus Sericytochromatia bacterium]|nr:dihydroorotate dehydrogenase [Candidatus Sericytochromatia bacterium]